MPESITIGAAGESFTLHYLSSSPGGDAFSVYRYGDLRDLGTVHLKRTGITAQTSRLRAPVFFAEMRSLTDAVTFLWGYAMGREHETAVRDYEAEGKVIS